MQDAFSLLENKIYKNYEIKLFASLAGYKVQAYKGKIPCYPALSIDYGKNADVNLKERGQVYTLDKA